MKKGKIDEVDRLELLLATERLEHQKLRLSYLKKSLQAKYSEDGYDLTLDPSTGVYTLKEVELPEELKEA